MWPRISRPGALAKTLFGNSASGVSGSPGKAQRRQGLATAPAAGRGARPGRAGIDRLAQVHVAVVAGRLLGQGEAFRRDQEGRLGAGRAEIGGTGAGEPRKRSGVAGDHAAFPIGARVTARACSSNSMPRLGLRRAFAQYLPERRGRRAAHGTGRARAGVMCLSATPASSWRATYGRYARSRASRGCAARAEQRAVEQVQPVGLVVGGAAEHHAIDVLELRQARLDRRPGRH